MCCRCTTCWRETLPGSTLATLDLVATSRWRHNQHHHFIIIPTIVISITISVKDDFCRRETGHLGVCTCTQPGSLANLGTLRATRCLSRWTKLQFFWWLLMVKYCFRRFPPTTTSGLAPWRPVSTTWGTRSPMNNSLLLVYHHLHCHLHYNHHCHHDVHDHLKARQAGLLPAAT